MQKNLSDKWSEVSRGVYYCTDSSSVIDISDHDIDWLISQTKENGLNYGRLCLHKSTDDLLQIMIIAFIDNYNFPIHSHKDKVEAYTILKGECKYITYSESKEVITRSRILKKGDTVYDRRSSVNHTLEAVTYPLVFQETTLGPFKPDSTTLL